MNLIGTISTGKVIDENEQNYFIQMTDGYTYLLDKAEVLKPLNKGSSFRGFLYENIDHQRQVTRDDLEINIDNYGWGTVTKVRRDLGVFVDIGIPNKDIVVSCDDLPTEKKIWPKIDAKLMVKLEVDEEGRFWGNLADDDVFLEKSIKAPKTILNKNIKLIVYHLKMAGTLAITDEGYLGFIHSSERYDEPTLGSILEGRVIKVHDNGTINISLKPRNYQAISDDALMILEILKHDQNHELKLNDHSTPVEIKDKLKISKGQFKRALGNLLKNNKVIQTSSGINLKE